MKRNLNHTCFLIANIYVNKEGKQLLGYTRSEEQTVIYLLINYSGLKHNK